MKRLTRLDRDAIALDRLDKIERLLLDGRHAASLAISMISELRVFIDTDGKGRT